jgi:flagellar protein FlaF
MSNASLALQGYKTAQKELMSAKSIERQIFGKITSQLQEVDLDQPNGFVGLAEAITQNVKLWNILFIDLTSPDNKLPMPLKNNLIALSEFVQAHSRKVLLSEADHQVLIDINRSIMAGLAGDTRPKFEIVGD